MKVLGIICALFFSISVSGQTKITVQSPDGLKTFYCDTSEACNKDIIFFFVEQSPSYKDGLKQLEKILNEELEIDKKFKGEIKIWFVINCTNKAYGFQIIKSVDPKMESIIIDLLSKNQNWVSGKQRGEAVDCSYTLRLKVKKGKIKILN